MILDPFRQTVGFDLGKPGGAEIAPDQRGMAVIAEGPPDRHRLGPEAAVRKADHNGSARAQHTGGLAQHGDGIFQILHRDANHRRVDAPVLQQQRWVAVEVLDEPSGEPRVGGKLGRVHAEPDHLGILGLGRQMADPAAHQVEQHAALRQHGAVEIRQRGDRFVIDVINQPRLFVEQFVLVAVDLAEGALRQPERFAHVTSPSFEWRVLAETT